MKMKATKKQDLLIPRGTDGCLGCPYYTFDSDGRNAFCHKYNTTIYSDGFRGIKTNKCKESYVKE